MTWLTRDGLAVIAMIPMRRELAKLEKQRHNRLVTTATRDDAC